MSVFLMALYGSFKFIFSNPLQTKSNVSEQRIRYLLVERLAGWCTANDLELNMLNSKEMVFDFRKKTPLVPLNLACEAAKRVKTFKFHGTTISCDLKWNENVSTMTKKAHWQLFFLKLKKIQG